MPLLKSLALVVRSRPYRETSILFTAITPEHGTLHFLGKGVRETFKGFMAPFEPITLLDIIFYERSRSQLQLLKEVNQIEHFGYLRADARLFALGCHLADITEQLVSGGQQEQAIFRLLIHSLRKIGDTRVNLERLSQTFKVRLLVMGGFQPELDRCAVCSMENPERYRFSFGQGGIVCQRCAPTLRGTLPISPGSLETIRYLIRADFDRALELRVGKRINLELKRLLNGFISYRLEGDLRTRRVLEQVGIG